MFPFDPFAALAGEAARIVTDGWIAICLGFWNAGLWLLRLALGFLDALLTPDISADGPGGELYRYTFWLAAALVVVLAIVQVGLAVVRRDARSLGRLALGMGQFIFLWGGLLGYAALLVQAAGGLTRTLMETLLNVTSFREWEPWTPFGVKDITDGGMATVLLIAGGFLLLAAIGQFLVMIMRSAALLILVATGPITAAGLVSDVGKDWFWKAARWFHAAVFSPVLMVLVLGIGLKFAEGVVTGGADTLEGSIGTSIAATSLIAVSAFSPVALFKLLAFVDPSTSSGASMRAGFAAVGGVQGLIRGNEDSPTTASSASAQGQSAGESSAQTSTASRVNGALNASTSTATQSVQPGRGPLQSGLMASIGSARRSASDGLGQVAQLGATATAIGADMSNQTGVGHSVYHPDFSGMGRSRGVRNNPPETRGIDPTPGSQAPTDDSPVGPAWIPRPWEPPTPRHDPMRELVPSQRTEPSPDPTAKDSH